MTNATFCKVTNSTIYEKLLEIEKHVITTNGKVKIAQWIGTTALTLVISLSLLLISGSLRQ